MKTSVFKISGMHCEGCAQIVRSVVERQDGVQTSTVSYADGTARVLFDPARIEPGRLLAVIEKAGYGATEQSE
ncbi:MAG: heavy-metal-associated domain-containing protein [Rhodanobacter sp.]|nr:MAG: heavy-metal-associated domain-containing protein [Rhodanobacter sp.]TAL97414.1 MAG: heavy-metal-associated domain-containing protein [Rhodanobacter sp.]TAM41023.1 MAG: heavy-metal-associated domain-containing protein [Rhodanobacter sp.]TAN23586.1 MAG: heavy-metal-associated domain-containing protein [Rhodanobacter sp.]